MIDESRLRKLFPRASQGFIEANVALRSFKPKRTGRPPLVGKAPGKETGDVRVALRITQCRARLLDEDNLTGSVKRLVDCLCEVGLIPGDAPAQTSIHVSQAKVQHYTEQKTIVDIICP